MLKPIWCQYGADPEAFLERDGHIIGSERVIPPDGVGSRYDPCVVRDGVQIEFHPGHYQNPYGLGSSMARAMRQLHRHLQEHPGTTVNYSGLVDVGRMELDS